MREVIETRVSPKKVWQSWEQAHGVSPEEGITVGKVGKNQFKYQILDVVPGESFSILWKTMFVRLVFKHKVIPTQNGSEISYHVQIKGLFSAPVRWILGNKIKKNLNAVLKAVVRQLESRT